MAEAAPGIALKGPPAVVNVLITYAWRYPLSAVWGTQKWVASSVAIWVLTLLSIEIVLDSYPIQVQNSMHLGMVHEPYNIG
jgi:hypothetical protein